MKRLFKSLLSLALFFLTVTPSYAREFNGYIVKLEGDTVRGRVIVKSNMMMPDMVAIQYSIHFRPAEGKTRRYEPRNLLGFGILDEDTLHYKRVEFEEQNHMLSKKMTVTVFMEAVTSGKVDLYHFVRYVAPGQRASVQAQDEAHKLLVRGEGKEKAVIVPMYASDPGFSTPMNYQKFFSDYLGPQHPLGTRITPEMKIKEITETVRSYNESVN